MFLSLFLLISNVFLQLSTAELGNILVCPVERNTINYLMSYISNVLHNSGGNNNQCQLHSNLKSDICSNIVTLLYDRYTSNGIETIVRRQLYLCHIRYLLLDVSDATFQLPITTACRTTMSTIVISLTNITLNVEQTDTCTQKSLSQNDHYLDVVTSACPRIIWVLGSNKNYNNTSLSVVKILRYKNELDAIGDVAYSKYYIKNKKLIISVIPGAPYVYKTNTTNGTIYYGVLIDMFTKIARNLQFTFSIQEPPDGEYGVLVNGSWTGLIDQLISDETDIAVADLTVTYKRSTVIDFTAPYYFESTGILIWKPDVNNNIWKMFSLFSINVWIAIAITSIVSVVVIFALHNFSPTPLETKLNKFGRCLWCGICCVTGQGSQDEPESWSVQTFMSFWLIYGFAICAAYSGGLIAILTTNPIVLPFVDLKGLSQAVKNGKYKLCVENGSAMTGIIMGGEGDYGNLKNFILKHPEFIGNGNCPDILKAHPDMALIEDRSWLADIQRDNCKNYTFIILDERVVSGFFAFGLRKNSLYTSAISQEITEAADGDIINGLRAHAAAGTVFCKIVQPSDLIHANSYELTLKEFTGTFVIFAIGLMFSMFAILFELCRKICRTYGTKVEHVSRSTGEIYEFKKCRI